jgi:oligoribonuclease (3'-5' exoribonuclease)
MKYISIDIETTGLNPEEDVVLEFAAIIADTENKNIYNFPSFNRILLHKKISGDIFAINMNANIIKEIKDENEKIIINNELSENFCYPDRLALEFKSFLIKNNMLNNLQDNSSINVAGKNFGTFDKLFLDKLFKEQIRFKHRILDPAILYAKNEDFSLPDLQTCLNRAGIKKNVTHRAIDDAFDVVKLINKRFNLNLINLADQILNETRYLNLTTIDKKQVNERIRDIFDNII